MRAIVSAAKVRELRNRSGAGLMACKRALEESGGVLEAALDFLRRKGQAQAARREGRDTREGLIGLAADGKRGALAELNCETDFVARSAPFRDAAARLAQDVLEGLSEGEDETGSLGVKLGEKIARGQQAVLEVKEGVVCSYLHNRQGENVGRIGVLVGLEGAGASDGLVSFGKRLAMHIAAARPLALDDEGLPEGLEERERAIALAQAGEAGKPGSVAEKIARGRVEKLRRETVLLRQVFVTDESMNVGEALEAEGKSLGARVRIRGFARLEVGRGRNG